MLLFFLYVLLALHCTSGEAHLIHKDLPSTSNFKVGFLIAMLISSEKPINTWPRFALTQPGPIKACFNISVYDVCKLKSLFNGSFKHLTLG